MTHQNMAHHTSNIQRPLCQHVYGNLAQNAGNYTYLALTHNTDVKHFRCYSTNQLKFKAGISPLSQFNQSLTTKHELLFNQCKLM